MRIVSCAAIILIFVLQPPSLARPQDAASTRRSGSNQRGTVDLSVSRIKLGSSYRQVIAQLGRPISNTTERDDSMGSNETIRTLEYRGLKIELRKSARPNAFFVVSIEVTSARWTIRPSLVRVGMNENQVKASLGAPYEESDEGVRHRYHYSNAGGDGWVLLEFEGHKLRVIGWTYDMT